jgi:ATP-dependent phosphoenolpyruvate carboxykinase
MPNASASVMRASQRFLMRFASGLCSRTPNLTRYHGRSTMPTKVSPKIDDAPTQSTTYKRKDTTNGGKSKEHYNADGNAFGMLPPIPKLSEEQAMYRFISGYTAKIPGTGTGVLEPSATFSTCFGHPFIILRPEVYASMLADRMRKHKTHAWLVNTV